jgi:hypothetical protein
MKVRRNDETAVDYDKPYEPNDVRVKGILYFAVGLVILIVVTFSLMWALLGVMRDESRAEKETAGPMAMSEIESLPPEPRLQAAPGFGVDGPNGRVNMELSAPQTEYRELRRQWDEALKKGEVDPATGTMVMMPIDTAKEKLLQENPKAKTGDDAQLAYDRSRMVVSDSSAGRIASEKRR